MGGEACHPAPCGEGKVFAHSGVWGVEANGTEFAERLGDKFSHFSDPKIL